MLRGFVTASRAVMGFIILACNPAGPCFGAGNPTFSGEGTAIILEGDRAAASQLAEAAALRQAVARAIESVIRRGTSEETQYNLKKSELLKPPYAFLAGRPISEATVSGKVLRVSVRIGVDQAALTAFLGAQGILSQRTEERRRQEFPPILVLIGEAISGKVNALPYSARLVTQTLLERGFTVVDEKAAQKEILHDQAVQAVLRGDAVAAQAVALQYGAGVVVSGNAVAEGAALKAGAMQVYTANVTLHAIYADSARVIATAAGEASQPHIDALTGSRTALEEASRKALSALLQRLQQHLQTAKDALEMSISGINYRQLVILKQILARDFKTITSLEPKSFQANVAQLSVTIDSSPEAFVDELILKDYGPFLLDLVSFSPRKIDLAVKIKDPARR